jgi:hypothetical protein
LQFRSQLSQRLGGSRIDQRPFGGRTAARQRYSIAAQIADLCAGPSEISVEVIEGERDLVARGTGRRDRREAVGLASRSTMAT